MEFSVENESLSLKQLVCSVIEKIQLDQQNISMRKAKQQLDIDAYLQEQWHWSHSGLPCEYLCQQVLLHATVTDQS